MTAIPWYIRQLTAIIKKFKFQELESTVIPLFPETSWNAIKSRLSHHHEAFTASNVKKIIEQAIIEHKINEKELSKRFAQLELMEISRRHNKKFWYGYELKSGIDSAEDLTDTDIRKKIIECFNTFNMEMEVNLMKIEGITFISMKKKEKKRSYPIFFALFREFGYFFCVKKFPPKEYIHAITEGTGHNKVKLLQLSGKDLKSLMQMIQIKKQGVNQCTTMLESLMYRHATPIYTNDGIDFRQHKQRREYAQKCFGDNPPLLNTLTVQSAPGPLHDKDISAMLPNATIKVEIEFKGDNIAALMSRLVEKRIMATPMPTYATHFMQSGKNEIKIKSRTSDDFSKVDLS